MNRMVRLTCRGSFVAALVATALTDPPAASARMAECGFCIPYEQYHTCLAGGFNALCESTCGTPVSVTCVGSPASPYGCPETWAYVSCRDAET